MEDAPMTKPTPEELREAAQDSRHERDFDRAAKYVDVSGPTTPISLRLPDRMLAILKEAASRRGMGYQTLLKQWLDERIRQEGYSGAESDNPEAHLQEIARTIVTDAVAELEQRLVDLGRRLAAVEKMESRILDQVGKRTGT